MSYILACLLIALAIFLWRTNGRDQYHFLAILQSFLAIAAFWVIGNDVSSENGLLLFSILSGFLLLHFIISRLWQKKNIWVPVLFIFLSSAVFFLFQNDIFNLYEFPIKLSVLPVFLLPAFGAMIVPVADMKEKVLGNFFNIDYKNRRGISRSVYVFLIGAFVFLGHFTANSVGVALVVAGFGANLLYAKKSGALWNMYLGLIGVLLLGHFAFIGNMSISNLIVGRVLEGLFFGGFVSLIVNTLDKATKQKMLAIGLSWFIILLIPSVLLYLGVQNVNLGGADAFIGMIVGFSFAAFMGINTSKNASVLAIYFALGILLLPLTVNKEAEEMTTISIPSIDKEVKEKTPEAKDIFENPGKEIDLSGDYSINSANSQLTFKLGPKGGVTKGAFKSFSGKFNFDTKTIEVVLPVNQLTTFVKMRDEELMGEGYFNESKFPEMRFVSKELLAEGDVYFLKGKFTMLGITVDKEIEMKYLGSIGENGSPILVGKAQIDRTKHGMPSDPKSGDIVDFTFKVELKK